MVTVDGEAGAAPAARIVVLGLGNVLWADEGFGVRCVEALQGGWTFAPHVELVDGGTQGLYLIQFVQDADHLLIFDAVDYGLPAGRLHLVEDEDVPKFLGAKKMSLHQTGFQEVLALAQLTGKYPRRVVLIGCQPEELEDYGGSLRASVREAMAPALERALALLEDWGGQPRRRSMPVASDEPEALTLEAYERGRPSARDACRIGDPRFLAGVSKEK